MPPHNTPERAWLELPWRKKSCTAIESQPNLAALVELPILMGSMPCSITAAPVEVTPDEQQVAAEARVRRLKVLVQLRRLYRNLIRGQCLLDQPSPVYSQAGAMLPAIVAEHRSMSFLTGCNVLRGFVLPLWCASPSS